MIDSLTVATPIWSRISRQDNNTFHIDWKDKREISKDLQERDNNYKNILLSFSCSAKQKKISRFCKWKPFRFKTVNKNIWKKASWELLFSTRGIDSPMDKIHYLKQ